MAFCVAVLSLPPVRTQDFEEGRMSFPSVRQNDFTIVDLMDLSKVSAVRELTGGGDDNGERPQITSV